MLNNNYNQYLDFEFNNVSTSKTIINFHTLKEEIEFINFRQLHPDKFFLSSEFQCLQEVFPYYDSPDFTQDILTSINNYGFLKIKSPIKPGKYLTGQHSVSLSGITALRFFFIEPFYILQENFTFEGIFFPKRKIFLYTNGCLSPKNKIEKLLKQLATYSFEYGKYFQTVPKFGGIRIEHQSPYHYLYFNIPALEVYNTDIKKINPKIWCDADKNYIDLKKCYKDEIDNVIYNSFLVNKPPIDIEKNIFLLTLGLKTHWVSDKIRNGIDFRIRIWASNLKFDELKIIQDYKNKGYMIVWLGVMTGKRSWLEEKETYIKLIQKLSKNKKVLIFIDGWTNSLRSSEKPSGAGLYGNDEIMFNEIKIICQRDNVKMISLIGKNAGIKVSCASFVDFFIANHGTGSIWVDRVARRKGLTHISNVARNNADTIHDHHNSILLSELLVHDKLDEKEKKNFEISYSIDSDAFLTVFDKAYKHD